MGGFSRDKLGCRLSWTVSDKVPRKDAMGSGQSIISKEDMEAYKELTYFTEAEVKECLKRFIALIDPKPDLKQTNIHDQQVSHKHIIEGLQELRVNPFADRICMVFSRMDQLMRFEEFLDMLSSMRLVSVFSSKLTTPSAQWRPRP